MKSKYAGMREQARTFRIDRSTPDLGSKRQAYKPDELQRAERGRRYRENALKAYRKDVQVRVVDAVRFARINRIVCLDDLIGEWMRVEDENLDVKSVEYGDALLRIAFWMGVVACHTAQAREFVGLAQKYRAADVRFGYKVLLVKILLEKGLEDGFEEYDMLCRFGLFV